MSAKTLIAAGLSFWLATVLFATSIFFFVPQSAFTIYYDHHLPLVAESIQDLGFVTDPVLNDGGIYHDGGGGASQKFVDCFPRVNQDEEFCFQSQVRALECQLMEDSCHCFICRQLARKHADHWVAVTTSRSSPTQLPTQAASILCIIRLRILDMYGFALVHQVLCLINNVCRESQATH